MISSTELAKDISLDLDQNAYTSWYDSIKIMKAINSACEFLHAYAQWPWTLTLETQEDQNGSNVFTLENEVLYPYWAELDNMPLDRTNVPPVGRRGEPKNVFFVSGNIIKTVQTGKVLNVLYHRGFKRLTSLGHDDIDMPASMYQVLIHAALWFVYPSGMDQGSSLANQHYNMMMTLLSAYGKAYGYDLQPVQAKANPIYHK